MSWAATLAPFRSNKVATSACPLRAATINGVMPLCVRTPQCQRHSSSALGQLATARQGAHPGWPDTKSVCPVQPVRQGSSECEQALEAPLSVSAARTRAGGAGLSTNDCTNRNTNLARDFQAGPTLQQLGHDRELRRCRR